MHGSPMGAAHPSSSAERPPARRVSRMERVGLLVQGGLDKHLTPVAVWLYRRTKGGITRPWKVDVLLLTTRGRRSGKERTVVLQFFPDGEDMLLAAANTGGLSHPGWYFNLVADPAASVEVMGRTIAVRAEEVPADAAAAWWPRILRRAPTYERYVRATSRSIPIVRLVPVAEGG